MNARRIFVACLVVPALFCLAPSARSAPGEAFPVTIQVDAGTSRGDLHPIWRFFGADEPNYAYMKDGRKLLAELGQLGTPQVYFRTHNLLNTGDGTPALKWGSTNAYTEDAQGKPVYDWTIVDRIFDTYLQRGAQALRADRLHAPGALRSSRSRTSTSGVRACPTTTSTPAGPIRRRTTSKWAELVYQWVKHCVEKYGRAEVEKWYWEVWNEPNIGYWKGTPEEFHKLHDYAVDARAPRPAHGQGRRAGHGGQRRSVPARLPRALPARHQLRHGQDRARRSTSSPSTPRGRRSSWTATCRWGSRSQLQVIDGALAIIASFPELKQKPIVIGESDPEGCAACQGPQLGYRNGTMYSSYTAASFARKHDLAEKHGVNLEGALPGRSSSRTSRTSPASARWPATASTCRC